eukprot:363347-Chlamydomonas_euryale.AAC.2
MPRLLALLLLASLSAGASAATAAAADGGSRRTGRLGVVVSGGSGGSIEAAHDSRMVAADMGASMAPAAVAGHMEDALPGDGERVDTAASDKPCAGAGGVSDAVASSVGTVGGRKPPKKMQFRTPKGLFIQPPPQPPPRSVQLPSQPPPQPLPRCTQAVLACKRLIH